MSAAHLVVRVGGERAALAAAAVERVVRGLRIQRLPGAAATTVGLAEFAGEPLAVIDLASWLGRPTVGSAGAGLIVVARLGDARRSDRLGLAVDEIVEVAEAEAVGDGVAIRGERLPLVDLALLAGRG